MNAGVTSLIAGSVLGAVCGFLGSGPAMLLAGGGHSHNDMFIVMEAGMGGAILGAALGPSFLGSLSGARERRRVSRLNGLAVGSLLAPVSWSLGALVAAFATFTTFYYALAIAELPPERGGPSSNPDPVGRARLALLLGTLLAITTGVLFVRAVRSLRRHAVER
jgi:hypothetical protein